MNTIRIVILGVVVFLSSCSFSKLNYIVNNDYTLPLNVTLYDTISLSLHPRTSLIEGGFVYLRTDSVVIEETWFENYGYGSPYISKQFEIDGVKYSENWYYKYGQLYKITYYILLKEKDTDLETYGRVGKKKFKAESLSDSIPRVSF